MSRGAVTGLRGFARLTTNQWGTSSAAASSDKQLFPRQAAAAAAAAAEASWTHHGPGLRLLQLTQQQGRSMGTGGVVDMPDKTLGKARKLALAVGALAGAFGSLVGVGGGVLISPIIANICKTIPQRVISGTSLAAVAATGSAAGFVYWSSGAVDLTSAALISASAIATVPLGARATHVFDCAMLRRLLAYWLFLVAPLVPLKPYIQQNFAGKGMPAPAGGGSGSAAADDDDGADAPSAPDSPAMLWRPLRGSDAVLMATGTLAGFASGLLGIGGGTIVTPLLTVATGLPQLAVLGTSLTAMVVPSLVGLMQHARLGNVDWVMAAALAAGTMAGGAAGGRLALEMPEGVLEWVFCFGMLFLARKTLAVQQVPALNSIAAAAAATHLAPMTSGALGPVPAPISAPLFKASSHVHASCPGAFPGASNRGCQSMPPGDGMQIFLTVDSGRPWGVQCLPQEGPATAHTAAAAGGDSQRPLVAKGRVLGNSAAVAAAVAQQRELGFGLNEPTHLGSGMRSSSREQDEEGTGCLVQQAIRHQQQHHQSGGRLRGAHGDAYDGDNFAQQMVHLHQNAWREEVAAAPDVGPLVIGEPWQAFEPGHGTSASSVAVAAGATAVLPGSAGGGGNAQDPRAITSVPSQMAFSAAHTSSLPDRSDLREQREQPIWDPLGAPRCHHCQQQVQQQQQQQRLRQLRELEEQCQAGQHQHMQMQQALLDLNLHRKQGSFGPPISQQLQQQLQHQLQPQQLPGLLTIQELLDPLPGLQQQEQQQLTWQGLLGPGQQQEGAGSFHAHAPAAQASSPPPRLFASGSSGCAAMAAAAAAGAGAGTAGAATGVHSQPLASLCQGYCRSQPYGLCRSVSGFPTSGGFSGDGGGGDGGGEEAFADIISEDVMEVSNPAVTTARHPYQGICLAPMSTAVGARDRTALRFSDHGIVHDIRGRGRGDVAAGGGSGATKRGRIELLFRSVDGSRDRDRDRES
ncbi:hypothetical protein VOLCADRAFT_104627 [Volvox carteri f. nagariensis]|uniref:Uncharacterized protein n=1 Tax=Volvox carteri f. nagariensis TaxID=3068 RepID=D8TUZ5_VOLCA|nr:uncharacterized protein VOLCADRAFT_104627 [Volvox carteri f. nagariensis]EFJ48905.1 hypothetical protein VOLCADRAFT_104627 [Volvox carteri f. nagariensis]|eukprot:XP_002950237.1 hypothetical protein VOLCADRAFT_104627 [Volvox carteri f. nagariensis]